MEEEEEEKRTKERKNNLKIAKKSHKIEEREQLDDVHDSSCNEADSNHSAGLSIDSVDKPRRWCCRRLSVPI